MRMPSIATPPYRGDELCFGGSFNPPHLGHLITARASAEVAGFARVRLIVAARSPHKYAADRGADRAFFMADAQIRLKLCRLAVGDDPMFIIDDRELRRAGPSYTADTAEELRNEANGVAPAWLVGTDLLPGLPTWHRADELLADPSTLIRFIIMQRGGHEIDPTNLPPTVRPLAARAVRVPQIEISASAIRHRLAAGRSIRFLVPEPVRQFLEEHRTYSPVD